MQGGKKKRKEYTSFLRLICKKKKKEKYIFVLYPLTVNGDIGGKRQKSVVVNNLRKGISNFSI